MNQNCYAKECDRPAAAKGLCKKHHKYLLRTGRLYKPSASERFWENVDTSGECWWWQGSRDQNGYGLFHVQQRKGVTTLAHRLVYKFSDLEEPRPHEVVDHLCHNTSCVRPSHLRITTQGSNTANRKGPNKASKSGYRGVEVFAGESGPRYRAWVSVNGKNKHLGMYSTAKEAAEVAHNAREQIYPVPGRSTLERAA